MAASLVLTRKRYEDQVKSVIAKTNHQDFAQHDVHILNQLLNKLTTAYDKLGDANVQVAAGGAATDTETFMAQFDDQVDEAISKIKRALAALQPVENPAPPPPKANEAHPILKSPIDNLGTFNDTPPKIT